MISEAEISFYKTIIDDLHIVFDVGCQHDNIFDELKPGIEVHLFDPIKSNQLIDKIEGKQNVTYNNCALGFTIGTLPIHAHYGSFLLREEIEDTDHAETSVPVDTLYNYCWHKNIQRIDFLKIDTEGFDLQVIKGCGDMLNRIRYIQFEHWTDELVEEIIQLLQPYKIIELDGKPKNYIAIL